MNSEEFNDLHILYTELLEGRFYEDHDESTRLIGVLRRHLDRLNQETFWETTEEVLLPESFPQRHRPG